MVYQDISQRNQAEIFILNIEKYLKKSRSGILMVKARSIDVSLKPNEAYNIVCSKFEKNNLKIKQKIDLTPYEKDHVAIAISY
jgi:fibrillarin-like pre-rRNA processing protein